ncbi:hypothetical protein PG996_008868 [Apiospora saccharicola]|uniref:DUF6546 domain-containing protein n=1 Tax=Apiospora saccharicola TaxID=335842 RepID=A0ABR1UZ51_9PEZI
MSQLNITWGRFPPQIRSIILDRLMKDTNKGPLGLYATVSQEWQRVIEKHNFSRIRVNAERLASFGSCVSLRTQRYVKYIWFCWELEEYKCIACAPEEEGLDEMPVDSPSQDDNFCLMSALETLFGVLRWWVPTGELVLDISVHSPSDSQHWFQHLSFEPDAIMDREKVEKLEFGDDEGPAGKCQRRRDLATSPESIISTVFGKILDKRTFESDAAEARWWRDLPSVPAVTSVLLRQQTRRRWNLRSLGRMFSRFPRLQEIHYEPWREWDRYEQQATDMDYEALLGSVASPNPQVRKVTLFENFNESYADTLITGHPRSEAFQCDTSRIPSPAVGRLVAKTSLQLEHLSASFIIDAGSFLAACHDSVYWTWPRLKTLILTTQVFVPDADALHAIEKILARAAAAARRMPQLETLHIWNGREGLAASFRYQASPPSITWRGTWPYTLRHEVIHPWKEVVYDRDPDAQLAVYHEAPDKRFVMKSHADAVHYLNLPASVIRPVSLQQIRLGDRVRAERRAVERQCMLNLIASGSDFGVDPAVRMV